LEVALGKAQQYTRLVCELSLPRFVSLHSVMSWFAAIQKPFYFGMFHDLVLCWNEYLLLTCRRRICRDCLQRWRGQEGEGRGKGRKRRGSCLMGKSMWLRLLLMSSQPGNTEGLVFRYVLIACLLQFWLVYLLTLIATRTG
jgi:hypothetical protein